MSLTTILLTVSVACNVWFVFLLMYDRIMENGTGNHRQEPFQNDGNPDNDYRTEATSCHFG